ncbi:MAG TPA: PDC sensor domain-containing protein, partial [bacterium]|nr:PDC sensor domain-containing protein [bacterium]
MQEIFVDDVEGNILSNILKYIETYPEIYEILVLNDKRKIIATKNQNNYYKQYNAEYLETIIRDGNVWISDLYFDDFLNHAVIAIGAPVYLQASKNIIGAMIVFLPVEMIYSINDSIIINNNIQSEDCYSILLNKNFQIISAPEFIRKNGKFKLFEQYDKDDIIYILTHKKTDYFIKSGYLYGYSVEKITNSNFVSKNWILLNQISSKTAFKKVYIFMLFFFVMLLIFTIVIILLSKIFSEKFTNPIINFTELFKKGVNGDLTIKYKIDLKNECFKIKNCVEKDCYCYENSDVFCFLKKTREQSFENIEDYGCQNCEVYKKKYDDEIKRMAILFNEFILSIKYLIMQLQDMSETMALISTNT